MKYFPIALVGLLLSTAQLLVAQPVIDARFAPIRGTAGTFDFDEPDTLAPIAVGANQIWDYSQLGNAGVPFAFLARQQGPAAGNQAMQPFTLALRFEVGPDVVHFYRNADTSGLYESGAFYGADDYEVSERRQLLLKYGLGFGQMYADSSRRRYFTNGVDDGEEVLADTVWYLGYGTLLLPNSQALTDAILIRRRAWASDSTGFYLFNEFEYEWYVPNGTGWPALSLQRSIDPVDPLSSSYSCLYQRQVITANSPVVLGMKLSLRPSPAREEAHIEGLQADRDYKVSIFGADGREHLRQQGVRVGTTLHLQGLAPGAYIVRISAGGGVAYTKLIKE